jgi:hypothetical protein
VTGRWLSYPKDDPLLDSHCGYRLVLVMVIIGTTVLTWQNSVVNHQ